MEVVTVCRLLALQEDAISGRGEEERLDAGRELLRAAGLCQSSSQLPRISGRTPPKGPRVLTPPNQANGLSKHQGGEQDPVLVLGHAGGPFGSRIAAA